MRMRRAGRRGHRGGAAQSRGRALAGSAVAVSVAAATLAGCGGSSGASGKLSGQTLTVFTAAPTGSGAAHYKQYYAYIGKLFHQQTGSTVNWEYYTSGAELAQKIESSVATHSGPDVFSVGSSYNGTVYGTHAFHVFTASEWKQLGGQSSFVPRMLTEAGPSNSQDIGVPFESLPYAMAYNKQLFARAGIKSPPATWTQWVSDAQAVQKAVPGVSGASFAPQDPYAPWKMVWSYANQDGSSFVNANATKATLTSAPVQAALKFYFGQESTYHIVPEADLTWQTAQATSAFTAGKTAMMPEVTPELMSELTGTPVAGQVGFAPMPSVPYGMNARPAGGKAAETIVSGNYYDVPSYVKNLRLAIAFIKASTSAQAQLQQNKIFGWMPVTDAGVKEVEAASPSSVPFIKAEELSTPTAFTPAWSHIEDGILAVISHVAQHIATTHSYSQSYVMSQLQAENAVVQQRLGGS